MSRVKEIFKSLSKDLLIEMIKKEKICKIEDKRTREFVHRLTNHVIDLGVKQVCSVLKLVELHEITSPLKGKIEFGENKRSKAVMSKRLRDYIADVGLEEFLTNIANDATLDYFSEILDIELDSDTDKQVKQLCDAIGDFGIEVFFGNFDIDFLYEVCYELRLETRHTGSKAALIEAIKKNRNVPRKSGARKPKELPPPSKHKPAIREGISVTDLQTHFTKEDLLEYCRSHGMLLTGKKSIVCKRILAYLAGDRETTMAAPPGSPRRRSKSPRRRSKSPSKRGRKPSKRGSTTKRSRAGSRDNAESNTEAEQQQQRSSSASQSDDKQKDKKTRSGRKGSSRTSKQSSRGSRGSRGPTTESRDINSDNETKKNDSKSSRSNAEERSNENDNKSSENNHHHSNDDKNLRDKKSDSNKPSSSSSKSSSSSSSDSNKKSSSSSSKSSDSDKKSSSSLPSSSSNKTIDLNPEQREGDGDDKKSKN
eukprot:TRINITY_DN103_c1_g1_i1.p1 TRINITY_DN103_c1_g1~~TRINITY_DN103_c1_g1_i1.p1  ORF type:complete len:502 (-),score=280.34 TRINITY_DN103_c1_g1_i1:66-1505(-)